MAIQTNRLDRLSPSVLLMLRNNAANKAVITSSSVAYKMLKESHTRNHITLTEDAKFLHCKQQTAH